MSKLSEEYSKNFSGERKEEFDRRFREDFDPSMSELSNILRILEEMRQQKANGGIMGKRIGFQEGTPKTTMVGNLKITVKPNESTEMAVLNALMSDVEGVVDDETKQDYYKILMPQLRNQMSKSRYEGLMGELFGRKDGGIGYLLGE